MSTDDVRQAGSGLATSSRGEPLLEAVDITKHYRIRVGRFGRNVVHAAENISVALYPGTVTAVVGESGSGKSTRPGCWRALRNSPQESSTSRAKR